MLPGIFYQQAASNAVRELTEEQAVQQGKLNMAYQLQLTSIKRIITRP